MKRYEIIPLPNTQQNQILQQHPEGDWVMWEDVEEYIREVEASLEDLQDENNKLIADTLTHLQKQVKS